RVNNVENNNNNDNNNNNNNNNNSINNDNNCNDNNLNQLIVFRSEKDNGFCDTCTMAGAFQRCRQSFLSGYLSDLVYWPILQTINFALVPPGYRVLYVIFFTSLWNTYLCFFNARMSVTKESPIIGCVELFLIPTIIILENL
ncbi:unnamed protein product, partial [Schistosoma margrebowiei]